MATALSLNACPYRAILFFHRRPQVLGSIEATTSLTQGAGEEAIIELTYAQLLTFEQGRVRLVVPTTIAPRYGDAIRQGGLQPDHIADYDLFAQHDFDLAITLTGAVTQSRIGSPTHLIRLERDGEAIKVALQGSFWLDRDFVLLLEDLEIRSFAIAGPDTRSASGHTALIASFCPTLSPAPATPLHLKILVDCSGSMAGDSIAQARATLRQLAHLFTTQDRVSYSRFGSKTLRVMGTLTASQHTLPTLLEAIDETDADLGGTEMAAALKDTFDIRMNPTNHSEEGNVLLITDGEVWNAQRIVNDARLSGHRIYALGVGSAPAESLLREMAEATGGACELVSPGEDMRKATQRLLARIRNTFSVQTALSMDDSPIWSSPLPRRLATDETAHVFMRLPVSPIRAPMLRIVGEKETQVSLTRRNDDLISRLVAAQQISLTTDKTQATELAKRYQLVTEDTNLLLVIERAEVDKTDGMPNLHQVRPMLAAGWGGSSKVQPSNSPAKNDVTINLSMACIEPMLSELDSDQNQDLGMGMGMGVDGSDTHETSNFLSMKTDAFPFDRQHSQGQTDKSSPAVASTAQIITAFNRASVFGQAFRPTLRAVTNLAISTELNQMIMKASQMVGGPLKGWACYLHWLHETGLQDNRLMPEALNLVKGQVNIIATNDYSVAIELFRAQSGHVRR